MSLQTWNRLIRFVNDDGKETFGDPLVTDETDLFRLLVKEALWAVEYKGNGPFSPLTKGSKVHVRTLLPLLQPDDVPIIRCIGLNYIKHIQEGGRAPPPYPSVFIKPSAGVAAYREDIPIPKVAQDGFLDYEGELVSVLTSEPSIDLKAFLPARFKAIVIGRHGKDIARDNALSHVAGYLVANDISSRAWQRDPKKAGSAPQWCFSKGFDRFAPLSPVLVSPAVAGNASGLTLKTWVNGEERQNSTTSDLLFGVEDIISFVSQGTTLEAGSVILTGTPSGVAMGMKDPKYLGHRDVVEVSITGIGYVRNKMVFESDKVLGTLGRL